MKKFLRRYIDNPVGEIKLANKAKKHKRNKLV